MLENTDGNWDDSDDDNEGTINNNNNTNASYANGSASKEEKGSEVEPLDAWDL